MSSSNLDFRAEHLLVVFPIHQNFANLVVDEVEREHSRGLSDTEQYGEDGVNCLIDSVSLFVFLVLVFKVLENQRKVDGKSSEDEESRQIEEYASDFGVELVRLHHAQSVFAYLELPRKVFAHGFIICRAKSLELVGEHLLASPPRMEEYRHP